MELEKNFFSSVKLLPNYDFTILAIVITVKASVIIPKSATKIPIIIPSQVYSILY